MDDLARFENAWSRFGATCFDTVAPEATYQAWLAHFLMDEFDPLQVVREVDFGSRHLDEEDQKRFPGNNLMLDIMILREPRVFLPRRAALAPLDVAITPNPRSGLGRLDQFLLVSELKVGSTQALGLDHGAILRDMHKLDALLRRATVDYPQHRRPAAVMCVLDNNPDHPLDRLHLHDRLHQDPPRQPITTLVYPSEAR